MNLVYKITSFRNIFFMLLTLLVFDCAEDKTVQSQKLLVDEGSKINEQWQGKDLTPLLEKLKVNTVKKNNLLIYLDATCGSCFSEIEKWEKDIFPLFEGREDVGFYFALFSHDKAVTNYILTQRNFPLEYVRFIDEETLANDMAFAVERNLFNTVLFGQDKKVKFIGSPVLSDNIKDHIITLTE